MILNYNNKEYYIAREESLQNLLQREDLLSLPLAIWRDILVDKYSSCPIMLLRDILKTIIKHYDTSDAVNSFEFKGTKSWLDKNTRVGLMNLANCSSENIQLVLGNVIVTLSPETLKQYLVALEVYAGKCYSNTAKHLLEADKLQSIEDIINYDYTKGYPEIIKID